MIDNKRQQLSFIWFDARLVVTDVSLFNAISNKFRLEYIHNSPKLEKILDNKEAIGLVIDLDIPSLKGLMALKQARQENRNIPIIMLTNQCTESVVIYALRYRVWDYIIKPFGNDSIQKNLIEIEKNSNSTRNVASWSSQYISCKIPSVARVDLSERENRVTDIATLYINNHYTEKLSESDLSTLCGLSCSEFSRKFKIEQEINYRDFVIKVRIDKAKELLKLTRITVTDVALNVGFLDLSHFTRTFTKYVGLSPNRFRKTNIPVDALLQ